MCILNKVFIENFLGIQKTCRQIYHSFCMVCRQMKIRYLIFQYMCVVYYFFNLRESYMYTESGCLVAYNFFISGYFFSLCRIRFFFLCTLLRVLYEYTIFFIYIFGSHFFLFVLKFAYLQMLNF